MLLFQAVAERGRLHLWGEVPATTKTTPPRSPFDAGAQLRPALAAIINTPLPKPTNGTLWLPSAEGQPIASSPLVAPSPTGTPQLAAWECTTLALTPALMVDVLAAAVGKVALGNGVVIGSSLAYWVQVLRFAGTLVNRDAYWPGLAEEKGTWRAVWRAVIVGEDARRLATLAKAMPGAARALGTTTAAPTTAAATVLLEVVNTLVDALVRQNPARPAPAKESLHEQWLHGLGAADGALTGPEPGWRELATQVAEWAQPITETAAAAFRLFFRLEEPADAEGLWHVRYLLQAHDDPSLLVPAADAWEPHGATADAFRRRHFKAREYLLASLGQAAKVCPPIDASLRQALPGAATCDVTGAYAFLTEVAWLLEQAGFGVMLPSWWTTSKRKLATSASVKSPLNVKSGLLSLDALVNVEWHVVLGDANISQAELLALAELKSPLVQVRGEWIHVEAAQLQAALEALQKKSKTTVRDLVRESLGGGANESALEIQGVQATGWVGQFLKQLNDATYEELAPPKAFIGELRPYQLRGYSWLAFLRRWGLGACLADDMGLGKTIQTLALLRQAWETDAKPTLLVCPTSVIGNWQREAAKFVPDFPVHIHHSPTRPQGATFTRLAKKTGLVLTSYGLLHRDAELLSKVKWGAVVLDEAQNIKNPETKQAKTARSLPADCKIALTGTPVENHVGDLWSIMEFLNPGFLGTHAEFRKRFFVPIQAKQDPAAAERLKKLTGPFVLRRLKTDKSVIADLPDKVEMNVYCRLTKEQASLYAATVENLSRDVANSEGIARKGKVLALLLRLKQLCNHPAQMLADRSALGQRSGKLNRLREMLEEIHETDGKVLLFSQFTDMGAMLQRFVQEEFGRETLYLHGGTSRPQRDEMVKRFQSPDGPRVFVLSLKAGGTGLNLTAANHVMHFDRWWNPAVENQATDRAFRIGQKRSVLVHKFVCIGTVEEKIDAMIEAKKEVAGKVVGTGEKWLTEMSDRDLKNILTLADDAVED